MFIDFSPDKHHILRLYVEVDDARTMDERHGFQEAWREELRFDQGLTKELLTSFVFFIISFIALNLKLSKVPCTLSLWICSLSCYTYRWFVVDIELCLFKLQVQILSLLRLNNFYRLKSSPPERYSVTKRPYNTSDQKWLQVPTNDHKKLQIFKHLGHLTWAPCSK